MGRIQLGIAVSMVVAACGTRPPSPHPPPAGASCTLLPAFGEVPDTLVVVLPDPVDLARAPLPTNDSERLLFRLLYRPLVRVDCTGKLLPAVASTWRSDDGGAHWTFSLAHELQFWDGRYVIPGDVTQGWTGGGRASAPASGGNLRAQSESVLEIERSPPDPDWARRTADPRLAVRKWLPELPWPLGTGPFGVEAVLDDGTIVARPANGRPGPVITFRIAETDPRDLLDRGADIVLTDQRAVLEYAATRPGHTTVALPWTRTHLMYVAGWPPPGDARAFRTALARDAVRVDARGAEPPFWWREDDACTEAPAPLDDLPEHLVPRLLYPAGDPVARRLAERLVALAGRPDLAAVGLPVDELARAIRAGGDAGWVLGLPRPTWNGCGADSLPLRDAVPLIDTRAWLIVREGLGPVGLDWDGVPWLGGLAR